MKHRRSVLRFPLVSSALPLLLLGSVPAAHAADSGTPPKPAAATATATKASPTPAPAPDGAMQVITVVEQRVGANAKIDRDTYDVKNNPATSNASAADVLNNVPAVAVDGDGKVTLRGSQNVRIMVDGKPAAQFQGPDGGANLSSLPAAALESVEVISTPGAEYGTEGGGGPILNLVMKRVQPPGVRGNLAANRGAGGRYNANATGTYSNGRLSADGTFSIRHDKSETSGESVRQRMQGAETVTTRQHSSAVRPRDALMLSTTLNYNLADKERLVASASLTRNEFANHSADHILGFIGASAAPIEENRRSQVYGNRNESRLLGFAYERKFAKPNEELRIDLRYSDNEVTSSSRFVNRYRIAPPNRADGQTLNSSISPTRVLDLTADYSLPLSRVSVMKAGLKLARLRGERDQDYFAFDPLTGDEVFDANRSSAFASTEVTYALYGSYDRWVSDSFMVRAGLRGEYTDQTMRYRQQQRAVEASNRYLMPNLAASYDFSKTSKLRFSANQRVERPRVEDLNPFLLYRDDYNSFQGDPRIAPQKTRNYELGWDHMVGKARGNLRFTRMHSAPMFATSRVPVAGSSTVITQRLNFGYRQSDTLSLTLSGPLTPAWNLNGTLTLGYDQQSYLSNQRGADGVLRSQGLLRKGQREQLQLGSNYRLAPRTFANLMLMRMGRQITPFGVSRPWATSSINLTHGLSDRLSLRLNLNDPFEWQKNGWSNDTGAVNDYSWTRTRGRIAYLGLSYRLGGVTGSPAVRNAGARAY